MRHRGFTMWIAILLIGFVSVVIAASTSLVSTDVNRTARETSDAQLRQLLIAGQSLVMEDLVRDGEVKSREISMPGGGQLIIQSSEAAKTTVRSVIAGRASEQSLEYVRRGGTWSLTRAVLP